MNKEKLEHHLTQLEEHHVDDSGLDETKLDHLEDSL
jgi:hypothetical protein